MPITIEQVHLVVRFGFIICAPGTFDDVQYYWYSADLSNSRFQIHPQEVTIVFGLGVLGMIGMTEVVKEEMWRMTLEVKAEGWDIDTVMIVKTIIIEEKHVVDMIKTMMGNMEESEVDMKVQGGHLVCNTSV